MFACSVRDVTIRGHSGDALNATWRRYHGVMKVLSWLAIVIVLSACGGDRSQKPATRTQERTCVSARDCAADEICRGPDGCESPSTCQKLAALTCGGPQTTMCGCDGATFEGDRSCPGRPIFRRAACDAPAACTRRPLGIDCDEPRGPCPAGKAREYADGCWQACVPIASCGCTTDAECPKEAPRCDAAISRCTR